MVSKPSLPVSRFSTRRLPAGQRHEAWQDRDWPSIGPIYRTRPLEPFEATTDRVQLGPLVLHYSEISGQSYERDAAMIRSFGANALMVAVTMAGEARGEMAGKAFHTMAGDLQFVDLAQTSRHESTASRTILLSIPRDLAEASLPDVASLHGRVVRSNTGQMLAAYLLGLRAAAGELGEADEPVLIRTIIDLLALALSADAEGRTPGGPDEGALGYAAHREIERRLGSPSLTIANLCRTLGISRSTLHRLFEREGGVRNYIREARLEAARRALIDPLNIEPIFALAEKFGFSDAAHFSRLFRARYGMTPTDCRTKARAQAPSRDGNAGTD